MTHSGQYFRAGVGAIISNGKGQVLGLERSDIADAWQLPQGGLEGAEEPLDAVFREIQEETGIHQSALQLIARFPELTVYELPVESRSEKTGRGQVHYWFLFRLQGNTDGINLAHSTEFRTWRWMAFEDLAEKTVEFRAPIYRRLAAYFRNHLDAEASDKSE